MTRKTRKRHQYQRHIKNLCLTHGITCLTGKHYTSYTKQLKNVSSVLNTDYSKNPTPFAISQSGIIAIHHINTERDYFYALHEIGHIITHLPENNTKFIWASNRGKVTKLILSQEQQASQAALELNKHGNLIRGARILFFNQLAYLTKYYKDWNSKSTKVYKYMKISTPKYQTILTEP